MIVLIIVATVIIAASGIGYLVLGRGRYGEMNSSSGKRSTVESCAGATSDERPEPCRKVRVYFIKPSHYDDLGYVEYFRWGVQPNNTLTVLAALNDTFNREHSSKLNAYLETIIWDEICD